MGESVGVAILTPMSLEFTAVQAHLHDPHQKRHPAGTAAIVGTVPGVPWPVAVIQTGEGNGDAGALAERVLDWLRPRALLVVGVAGTLKDDIELGDVVVATWVYGYHSGKEDTAGSHARPRSWPSDHSLTQAARMAAADDGWAESLGGRPTVHFKPIAAGDVLLSSLTGPLRQQLHDHYNDVAAIEMESAGVMAAAHLRGMAALTVRGISDRADDGKQLSDQKGSQPAAAANAAAFAMAILREPPAAAAAADAGRPYAAGGRAAATELGPAWRPLSEPSSALWPRDLGVPLPRDAAILEVCLLPAVSGSPLERRRLAVLPAELASHGRAGHLFAPAEQVSETSGRGAVAATAQAGLAVTRRNERCGWQALPTDSLGAVLDEEDLTSRLAALVTMLSTIDVPPPPRAAAAVGVTPTVMLAEGRVGDMPRTTHRGRTTQTLLRVPAAAFLPWPQIAGHSADVAAELAGDLLSALRSRHPG